MKPAAPTEHRESLRELGEAFATVASALLERGVRLEEAVTAFEGGYVRTAVERSGGNLSAAAVSLGIHRNTLRAKLQRNGQRPTGGHRASANGHRSGRTG